MTLFVKKIWRSINYVRVQKKKIERKRKHKNTHCTCTHSPSHNTTAMTARILHNFRFSSRMSSAHIFFESIQWAHCNCTHTYIHAAHTLMFVLFYIYDVRILYSSIDLRVLYFCAEYYGYTAAAIFKTHSFILLADFLFVFACLM